MKLLALALVGAASLAIRSVHAVNFISTCDIECAPLGQPCTWPIEGKTGHECDAAVDKCTKECVAKNGLKKYIEDPALNKMPDGWDPSDVKLPTPTPTPKVAPKPKVKSAPKPTTKAPSYSFRSFNDGKKIN